MMAVIAVGALDMLLVTPLTGLLARAFTTTPDSVGLLVTSYALASAMATPLLAPLVVRKGTVRSMKAGLILLAAANAFAAILPPALGLGGLALARAASGIGGGVAMTLCHVHVLQVLPREERAGAIGWITAGFFLATVLLLPLTTFLADHFSWRGAFALTAAAVAAAAWSMRAMPDGTSGGAFRLAEYRALISRHGVPWGLAAYFAYGAGFTAVSTYFAPWVESHFHVSTSFVGFIFLGTGVAAFLAAPFAGYGTKLLGCRPVAIGANTLMAAVFAVLPGLGSVAAAAAAYAVCSPLASWRFTSTMAALGELVPLRERGPLLLVNNTAILGGMALGAAGGGRLFAQGGYAAAAAGASMVTILASLSVLGIRPAPGAPPEPPEAAPGEPDPHEPPRDDAGILPG